MRVSDNGLYDDLIRFLIKHPHYHGIRLFIHMLAEKKLSVDKYCVLPLSGRCAMVEFAYDDGNDQLKRGQTVLEDRLFHGKFIRFTARVISKTT